MENSEIAMILIFSFATAFAAIESHSRRQRDLVNLLGKAESSLEYTLNQLSRFDYLRDSSKLRELSAAYDQLQELDYRNRWFFSWTRAKEVINTCKDYNLIPKHECF